MNDDFLLVNKAILPDILPNVIQARDKIEKDGMSVTEACKSVNISRSVYYKYKDMVYLPSKEESRKAILSLKVDDKPGVLNAILQELAASGANVLTIFQDTPVRKLAIITIKISIESLIISLEELISQLKKINFIRKAEVVSYE